MNCPYSPIPLEPIKPEGFLPAPVSPRPNPAARSLLPLSGNPLAVRMSLPMTRNPDVMTVRPFPPALHPDSPWTRAERSDLLSGGWGWIRNVYRGGAADDQRRQYCYAQKHRKEMFHVPLLSLLSYAGALLIYFRLPNRCPLVRAAIADSVLPRRQRGITVARAFQTGQGADYKAR
jgi:hypothetical protein